MRSLLVLALAALVSAPVPAQFGGLRGLKDRIDKAKDKAKPATDRAQRAVDTFQPWSADYEQQIGAAAAAKMVAIFGLVEEPSAVRYVNLVGQAVAQYSTRSVPYRFAILNTDISGAFAIPGGYIFITLGALELMKNEAQLAGALGHEVVHVAERHLEREIRSKKTTNWAVEEARAQTGDVLQERADALVKDLLGTKLSRDKEDFSDEQGAALAAKAGYTPAGLVEFLANLAEASKQEQNQQRFGQWLSTHPPFDERLAHLQPIAGSGTGQTLEARFQEMTK